MIFSHCIKNILDLYYASLSGNEIYKIKIKTLLKCPNKEEANKNSKLVKRIANPILPMAAAEHVVFYSNVQNMSILGTNIYKKSDGNTVRYLNTIIIYISIHNKLFGILLTIVISNNC